MLAEFLEEAFARTSETAFFIEGYGIKLRAKHDFFGALFAGKAFEALHHQTAELAGAVLLEHGDASDVERAAFIAVNASGRGRLAVDLADHMIGNGVECGHIRDREALLLCKYLVADEKGVGKIVSAVKKADFHKRPPKAPPANRAGHGRIIDSGYALHVRSASVRWAR